jgi:hypothetical protein
MSERRPHRVVVKKRKSALDVDSKQGRSVRSKRPINLCRMLKDPPREQTPKPTDDEVPLKIHSPIEARGSLRECVKCRKQDQSMIMKKRELACYDAEKEAYEERFWSLFPCILVSLCVPKQKEVNCQYVVD